MIDLTPPQLEIVRAILQRHLPGRDVRIYGSRARGDAKPFSDLDLAVMGNDPVSPGTMAALQDDFTESDLPFKVDVLEWATLSESFREAIRKDLVILPSEAADHVGC